LASENKVMSTFKWKYKKVFGDDDDDDDDDNDEDGDDAEHVTRLLALKEKSLEKICLPWLLKIR